MASLQENINFCCNSTLNAMESAIKYEALMLLDEMHKKNIINHEEFFEYREKFNDVIRKSKESLWRE